MKPSVGAKVLMREAGRADFGLKLEIEDGADPEAGRADCGLKLEIEDGAGLLGLRSPAAAAELGRGRWCAPCPECQVSLEETEPAADLGRSRRCWRPLAAPSPAVSMWSRAPNWEPDAEDPCSNESWYKAQLGVYENPEAVAEQSEYRSDSETP